MSQEDTASEVILMSLASIIRGTFERLQPEQQEQLRSDLASGLRVTIEVNDIATYSLQANGREFDTVTDTTKRKQWLCDLIAVGQVPVPHELSGPSRNA